jgi:hypothetical protein
MSLGDHEHEYGPGDDADHEPGNSGGSANPKLPPTGGPPELPPTLTSGAEPEDKAKKWLERTKLILEVGGLIVLIIYTVFAGLQWRQTRWTNRLTREALNDSNISLAKTLEKMQGQTTQASRLATATEAANATAIYSERPWIGGTLVVSKFEGGASPIFKFVFPNSGKRPAILDRVATATFAADPGNKVNFDAKLTGGKAASRAIIVPGQVFESFGAFGE